MTHDVLPILRSLPMTTLVVARCLRPGCGYVAVGRSEQAALNGLLAHLTAQEQAERAQ
jgi:hypothetical protein